MFPRFILFCFVSLASNVISALPKDCTEVQASGHETSGQYIIFPQDGEPSFPVFCDTL